MNFKELCDVLMILHFHCLLQILVRPMPGERPGLAENLSVAILGFEQIPAILSQINHVKAMTNNQ